MIPGTLVTAALSIFLASAIASGQSVDDFRSGQTGNWNSTGTWERWNGSTWVTPAPSTPTSGNGVITIQNGHTVTVTAGVTVDQVVVNGGGQITLNSGVTLTIANGTGTDIAVSGIFRSSGTITVNASATIAFNSGGTYQHSQDGGTIPTATWNSGSTCLVTGTVATLPGGFNQTFGHLTWNCAGQTSTANLGSTLTITGNLTVQSTGGSGQFRFAVGTSAVAGNFTESGGTVRLAGGSARTVTAGGDFTMSGGTLEMANGTAIGTLNASGNFSHTGGTIQESGTANGAIVFNGSGTQTYTSGGTVLNTINFTVNSGATLQMGTSVITGGGAFTLSAGGTLNIGSAAGITSSGASGNIQVTGTRSYNTGANYAYNGSAVQSTGNGLPATVNNFTINNAGGSVSLTNAVTVNGTLTFTNGAIVTGANTLSISSSGTVSRTSGHVVGNFQKYVPTGATTRSFEIGDASNYTPITVSFASVATAGNLLANTTSAEHPNIATSVIDASKSVNRYWTMTSSGTVFTTYDATFNFVASDVDGGANTSNFIVGKYNAPNWSRPTLGTRTATSTQATGLTSFSDIAIGEIKSYTITASAGANGSISPSGAVTANYGSDQTFTVTPNTGYHVDSLIVDGTDQGALASYTFTNVTANHTIRAVFAIDQFTITASAGPNGLISPSGAVTANYGSDHTFTITPTTGYHVDSLIVDGVDQGALASHTFTNVTANHTIHAVFAIDQFTITASAGSNGSISPSGSVTANYGSDHTFTVTPSTGYHVDSLIVDGTDQGQLTSHTFTSVTANHVIRAVFAIDQFTITASAGANGSISPSGSVTANYGSDQTFTVTPNIGYHVDSLIVDGTDQGALASYTFTNVTANHTIRAVFAIDQFTITASAGSNGSISPSGSVTANYGSDHSFTITPNTGYHVDSMIVDGVDQGALTSYTFTNVTANHTIRAVFAIDQFTITASAGSNGSISPSGSVTASYGSDHSFTITPNTGYYVDSLIVDGTNQGAMTSYTFTNVTANHVIRAVFAIDQFTITASAGSNGSISPSGSVTANYGSDHSFTVTPNTGYHVDSMIVDGVDQGALTSYTFTNVTANHTIRAVFAIDQFTITASAGSNGSISPSGSVTANYGSDQTFTITPSTGYHVDSMIVDGVDQGALTSYTFTNVTANHTIRAVFAIDQFTITASAGPNGLISPSGAVTANYGSNHTFTVTPSTGYHVDSLIVDGTNQGAMTSYTFTNVTANHTIRAVFAINRYTIASSAGAGGTIAPSGSVLVPHGFSQSFTLTPDPGFVEDSVMVDGAYAGSMTSYTFVNVTGEHTIHATFVSAAISAKYRSFVYDSLHVKKRLRKKFVTSYSEFMIVNDLTYPITEINVRFKYDVREIVSSWGLVPTGFRKEWVFAGAVAPHDSVVVRVRNLKPIHQAIGKLWLGPITGPPFAAHKLPRQERYELPMPNVANVRDDAFARGAFAPTSGLLVGVPRSDSARSYGWVRILKSLDMYKSTDDRTGYHAQRPRGFDKLMPLGRPFVKEQKRLSPVKHNNRLFADLLTLKFNIAISSLRITPAGFGELRFVEAGNPFDGLLVRQISARADSALTFWTSDSARYRKLDSTIMKINASFSGVFDTVSWADTLKVKGVKRLSDVAFLKNSEIAPAIVEPTVVEMFQDIPTSYELMQNYPNPFNPTTTIQFHLGEPSIVTLRVYNILGQEVATLLDNEILDEGEQEIDFDAGELASGAYFYRMIARGLPSEEAAPDVGRLIVMTKKMLVVR